jgi:hypothetical protein
MYSHDVYFLKPPSPFEHPIDFGYVFIDMEFRPLESDGQPQQIEEANKAVDINA